MWRWWQGLGWVRYPLAKRLLITADGGGNGSRLRLWKRELQRLADELAISIEVHHLPPGTTNWNKIEPRLFSFITHNWRAKLLGQLSRDRRSDRRDENRNRTEHVLRTQHQQLQ